MDKDSKLFYEWYEWVENKLENIDNESILYELKNFPGDIDDGLYFNTLDIPGFCKKYNIDKDSLNNLIIEGIISDVASKRMYDVKLENSALLGPYVEDDE